MVVCVFCNLFFFYSAFTMMWLPYNSSFHCSKIHVRFLFAIRIYPYLYLAIVWTLLPTRSAQKTVIIFHSVTYSFFFTTYEIPVLYWASLVVIVLLQSHKHFYTGFSVQAVLLARVYGKQQRERERQRWFTVSRKFFNLSWIRRYITGEA